MKYYIDAYDWVMVGNVYGMSGFSDGGTITTKPYISSSNYLLKMSDYSKNESWCVILDALYWRFLFIHSIKFNKNPRMKMQIALLNKMPKEKLENHLKIANDFLKNLFIAN
jgi:deoxyribodipyrimidine photolyase-related protein